MALTCHGCGADLPENATKRRKWCSERCRKRTLYSVPCIDCGKPLNGSDGRGPNAPTRCIPCACKANGEARKVWTREAIIDAMHWWAREYGEFPAVADWCIQASRDQLHDPERAERYLRLNAEGRIPDANTVRRGFGSWAGALIAAGFTPRAPHGGGGNGQRQRKCRAKAAA